MTQNPSRRHHYIPEFYLKRWCASNGKLVEFSKPYGNTVKPMRRAPCATGFLDRLYALEGVPDEISGAFEQEYFCPVDSRASTVLDKMERGGAYLDEADRVAWTQFLVSLIFRNPENVTATKDRLRDSLPETTVHDSLAAGGVKWWTEGFLAKGILPCPCVSAPP